jgi:hypothetical protein
MPKLTGAKKAAFLARMEKGRRKAKRAAPAAKRPAAPRKKPVVTRKKTRPASKKRANPALRSKIVDSKKIGKKGHVYKTLATRKDALALARRLNEFEGYKRYNVRDAQKKKSPRRRNGSDDEMDAAARQFEAFHGKPPERIIEIEQAYRYPATFAELGHLKELRFDLNSRNRDFPLTGFGKACQVVCTPDGSNIYFLGGDQSIDFEALDISSDKDFVDLGPCTYIAYHTVKGFHDFAPTTYWHRFGEEDKIMPSLTYDRLNKTLFLVSGNYRVKPEGIVN